MKTMSQASHASTEAKLRDAQEERNVLIERIKQQKEKEIQWFNEQNEREQEERRRRLAKDIETAVCTTSYSTEDKTYGLVNSVVIVFRPNFVIMGSEFPDKNRKSAGGTCEEESR
ncbi:unnamed protein product [Gongylonema pulchrum]|uniref:CCDC50_N domain-containing protein n=1 Tax=Gongylonema pulchrum TaxID=637853 RepID=A0A183DF78_9BILA|nr:unnamed protein product [Gongylonema pulchrum]